jgi:hypothetical protein
MNALRNINKQLEAKSDDIKQKVEQLSFLQEKCTELETKCEEQSKQLQMAELERVQSNNPEAITEELTKKYY